MEQLLLFSDERPNTCPFPEENPAAEWGSAYKKEQGYDQVAGIMAWEAEGVVEKDDHGLKVGCRRLTAVKRLEIPPVTREDRVRFAILCSLEVYDEPSYVAWAHGWLSNEDRSAASRSAASALASWSAESAARSAAESAARSAAESAKTIDLIAIAKKAVDNSRI